MEDVTKSAEVKRAGSCPAQIMTFRVGEQVCGLGILDIHEIVRYQPPEFPPGEPAWMLGVIHLRGEILPAVDARVRLGMPGGSPGPAAVYVVFGVGGKRLAVLVDAVLDVVQLGDGVELDRPPGLNDKYSPIAGFVRVGDRTVALLKAEAFVPVAHDAEPA